MCQIMSHCPLHRATKARGLQVIFPSWDIHPSMKSKYPQATSLRPYHSEKTEQPHTPAPCSRFKRGLHSISSGLRYITAAPPGGPRVWTLLTHEWWNVTISAGGLHNSTETGNGRGELASREDVAQCINLPKWLLRITGYDIQHVTLQASDFISQASQHMTAALRETHPEKRHPEMPFIEEFSTSCGYSSATTMTNTDHCSACKHCYCSNLALWFKTFLAETNWYEISVSVQKQKGATLPPSETTNTFYNEKQVWVEECQSCWDAQVWFHADFVHSFPQNAELWCLS